MWKPPPSREPKRMSNALSMVLQHLAHCAHAGINCELSLDEVMTLDRWVKDLWEVVLDIPVPFDVY